MKQYEAWVTGVTGRRVTVEAKNQEAAEIEAMREFNELVGAESDVEVIEIKRIDDEDEDEDDWREDFWEVRVFASKPIEFTLTVKADDEDDAIKNAQIELDKLPTKTLLAHDQYEEPVVYELSDWNVLGIEEAFGFENTPEDLKEAKQVAWNVEDES